mmetsp:Transcript_10030/g.26645  ORF Transcript_10030/g.26645 Transcript_10030/m.26645 type:complete len:206 (+) Transcript_10030:506-1123(+)
MAFDGVWYFRKSLHAWSRVTVPLAMGSAAKNSNLSARSSSRLFASARWRTKLSCASLSAALPMRPRSESCGSGALLRDASHSCPRTPGHRGRSDMSRSVISLSSSCNRGMSRGRDSHGNGRDSVARMHAFRSCSWRIPSTPICGTRPIMSWKKVIPRLKTSPLGYHLSVRHVSGGMYPGVPQMWWISEPKSVERPKSISTGLHFW